MKSKRCKLQINAENDNFVFITKKWVISSAGDSKKKIATRKMTKQEIENSSETKF